MENNTISYLGYTIKCTRDNIWNEYCVTVWDAKGEMIMSNEHIPNKETLTEEINEIRQNIIEIAL